MAENVVRSGRLRRGLEPAVRLARRIASERTTPARTGLAVGMGVLIGTTPFFGFHLAICLVAATLLGLNRAITYLAANISVPWIAPFLIFASVQTGSVLLRGELLPLDRRTLAALDPWSFGASWLIGALVVGVALGTPAGVAAFWATHVYRRRHPLPPDPLAGVFAQVAARYVDLGRFALGYVRGKLRHDPVFRQLAERVPLPAPVLDVGCGRGQSLVLLAVLQPDLEALGIDWDEPKLALARAAARPWPALRYRRSDIRAEPFPEAGTILMIDVLHYNPAPLQDDMLRRAARALRPGGVLFVRELDAARSWRAAVNRWQERVGCWLRLNRGATLCFRPAEELVAVLAGAGLETRVIPSWADLPLANVLIEARRPSRIM